MNHHLFRHLVENQIIAPGVNVGVVHTEYYDLKKSKTYQGTFVIERIYADALLPDTRLVVFNGDLKLDITKNDIKLVGGVLPSTLGYNTGYSPFELPEGEKVREVNDQGKFRRVRLNDSLDEFSAKDFLPDNYKEEVVDPSDFVDLTVIEHGQNHNA